MAHEHDSHGGTGGKRPIWKAILYWGLVVCVWVLIAIVGVLAVFARDLPDTSKLFAVDHQPTLTYLDRSGALIASRGSPYGPPVNVKELPPHVPQAFIAIEDRRFYHHPGFDPIGITRAMAKNIACHCVRGGGSTITQQLAKNLFLTPEQNMSRKIKELLLALWLERKFTKDEILGLYMNRVYFGAGAYGIEAASQRYFNKSAKQLTIGEAALLAGMMKGPERYSPLSDSERASRRATVVLNEMVDAGVITPEQRAQTVAQGVRVSKTLATAHAAYFVDWLDPQVRQLVGETTEDLVIETTLDLPIQTQAEAAVTQIIARDTNKGVQQAALVALDGDGRVRAMIGGANYGESQFNRAIKAQRQAGSSFKAFVYATAMEAGLTPDQTMVDEPVTIGTWSPKNYTERYLGEISLETAYAQSVNTVAARLADQVGRGKVADMAHRLGLEGKINTDPAMSLGAVEVTPLSMASAYAPFANGGFKAPAFGITRIRTSKGQVLYERKDGNDGKPFEQVLGNPALSYMNRMMRQVVASGTARGVAMKGYDLAGKTGTTSNYVDAWFVGYTGGFVTAVWVGRDDNTPMKKVTGGGTPAAIWRAFMGAALPRLKVTQIPGGPMPLEEPKGDLIGDLLNGSGGASGGVPNGTDAVPSPANPPASTPAPTPSTPSGTNAPSASPAPASAPAAAPSAAGPSAPVSAQPQPAKPKSQPASGLYD